MRYELNKLNFKYEDLEPYIDKETMKIHYEKHHAGYAKKLENALQGHKELLEKPAKQLISNLQELPDDIVESVRNNGGGYVNHNLFWDILGPENNKITGLIKEDIINHFGSIESFKKEFEQAALTQFGSGWAFLVVTPDKKLKIVKKPNQDSPLSDGNNPILALDVWEHAYYLNYQNKRADYVKNFWNVINWVNVDKKYKEITNS